jgi:hypothetical protein
MLIITFLSGVVDWIVFGWLFWVLLPICIWTPHAICKSARKDFEGGALFFVLPLLGLVWWRWPGLFPHTWGGWTWLTVAYLFVGFVYSLGKYVRTLGRFKAAVQAALPLAKARDNGIRLPCNVQQQLDAEWTGKITILSNDSGLILDWRRLPLANWWIYWPWFSLSSVFTFIQNFGKNLVNLFRGLYDKLAARFAVKL